MPNTVLNFRVADRHARAGFHRLQQEITELEKAAGEMRRELREAGAAIDRLGDPSRTTAKAVETLGTAAQQRATQVDRLGTAATAVNKAFADRIAFLQQEKAALDAAAEGRANYFRVRGQETAAGRQYQAITTELERLQAAHVSTAAHSEYLQNAQRALTAANARTTITAHNASKATEHFARALAKLRANADDARDALTQSRDAQQFAATFQTATDASPAYDTERIRQVAAARSAEKVGLAEFSTGVHAAKAAVRARVAFAQQMAAIPDIQSPDAPYGKPLTSGLRRDFQETERQGRSLLSLMQAIANLADGTDVEERLPDPLDRGVAIDERIAAAARGTQALTDMRQTAAEQGRQFLRQVHRSEERDTQSSLNARARHYRHFTNLVSNAFVDLAAGRTRSFESVATTFIEHSIRLISRAVIENQILKRLDDTLTASKLANLRKVEAARASSGLASGGGLGGLIGQVPGLGNLGGALSGGGFALGAASLLFPEQIQNITGGIADTIKGVLENVSRQPVVVKAHIQNNLRIGENEAREISDIQAEMRTEDRL